MECKAYAQSSYNDVPDGIDLTRMECKAENKDI